jgi:DNA integrity scanning protein DisA with diadenylate cyclase activity
MDLASNNSSSEAGGIRRQRALSKTIRLSQKVIAIEYRTNLVSLFQPMELIN